MMAAVLLKPAKSNDYKSVERMLGFLRHHQPTGHYDIGGNVLNILGCCCPCPIACACFVHRSCHFFNGFGACFSSSTSFRNFLSSFLCFDCFCFRSCLILFSCSCCPSKYFSCSLRSCFFCTCKDLEKITANKSDAGARLQQAICNQGNENPVIYCIS